MKHNALILVIAFYFIPIIASANNAELQQEVQQLQQQTRELQAQLNRLQTQLVKQSKPDIPKKLVKGTTPRSVKKTPSTASKYPDRAPFHTSSVTVNAPDADPESLEFYPTALVADNHVLTYIAGTPVVTSPYLGSRPAFDGSDYIVNISSINRDIRLMQQRRSLYRAYDKIGYPVPNMPILALSGKAEPIGVIGQPYIGQSKGDWTL